MLKYPKTFHFSWSENLQNDDKMLPSDDIFLNKEVICSEKLDGECSGLSREGCHARSLDSRDHVSRHWLKSLWGKIRYEIPKGYEIFGENMFARHSIFYNDLTTYFYVFAIFKNDFCLSWDETKEWCYLLELTTVPELYRGIWNAPIIKSLFTGYSAFGQEQEGYVVRTTDGFSYTQFPSHVGKFVRKNHIKTSEFWMNEAIIPNILGTTDN